jgi:flagellar motor protein MotB
MKYLFKNSPPSAVGSTAESHNYLGSATDLMTGLVFVFIIMVAFLAYQRTVESEARMEEAEAHKRDLDSRKIDRDPRGSVTLAIGNRIREALPSVRIDPASGIITLPEDALFERGNAGLKSDAVARLKEVANRLGDVLSCYVASERGGRCPDNPNGHEIDTIFIEGHTDSVPMLRPGGNIRLSLDRAISVNDALLNGTGLAAFHNDEGSPIFSYSAYAETRPLRGIDPTDGRNRRVDLRIVLTYRPPQEQASESLLQRAALAGGPSR